MYKVIIVDDEPIIREGLKASVNWEEFDCQVVGTAGNGLEGIELVKQVEPDIIFSDISMNNMDGLAMVAAIKSEYPDMQVTLLTGYRNFEYAQRAIKLGVTRFLLKPSKMDEIKEAIEAMIEKIGSKNVVEETQEKPEMWDMNNEMEKYLYEVFVKNANFKESSDGKIKDTEANRFILKNALVYIYEKNEMKLSLQDVSEQCFISSWHLSKLLNQYTGKRFFEIINVMRVDRAKELLKNTDYKIQDISEMIGFQDVTHFSRIFKAHMGMSPKEYRSN